MGSKLNTGDTFPRIQLKLVDGGAVSVPDSGGANYQIVLFYRGSF